MKAGAANDQKEAIVVLGMHRSGTSAMARVLSLAGCKLPNKLMVPTSANPTGYWEPQEVADYNDSILNKLDVSWDDMFGPRRNRQKKLPTKQFVPRAREVISNNYEGDGFIVLKEPRIAVLMDVWGEALKEEGYNTNYIIMVRHPLDVAHSLKSRDGFVENKSLLLWSNYMLASEIGTRSAKRIFVKFEDLIGDAESVLDRVENELGLILPRRSWDSSLEIQEFLNKEHVHHRIGSSTKNSVAFGKIGNYYDFLEAASRGEPWNVDVSTELAEWLGQLETVVGPIFKHFERSLRTSRTAAEAERRDAASKLDALKAQAEAAENRIATREAEIAGYIEQQRTEVEARLAKQRLDASEELSRLASELDVAKQALLELERQKTVLEADLRFQIEQHRSNTLALEATLELAKNRLAEQEAEFQERIEQARSTEFQLETALEQARSVLADREAEFEDRLEQSSWKTLELETALDLTKNQLAEKEAEFREGIEQSRATALHLETALELARSQLAEKEAQFQERMEQASWKTLELETALELARNQLAEKEAEFQERIEQSRSDTLQLETALGLARNQLAEKEAEFQERIEQSRSDTLQLETALEQARGELADREAQFEDRIAQSRLKVRELEMTLELARSQLAHREADFHDQIERSTSNALELVNALALSRSQLAERESDFARRLSQADILIRTAEDRGGDLERSLASLQSQMVAREAELNDRLEGAMVASHEARERADELAQALGATQSALVAAQGELARAREEAAHQLDLMKAQSSDLARALANAVSAAGRPRAITGRIRSWLERGRPVAPTARGG